MTRLLLLFSLLPCVIAKGEEPLQLHAPEGTYSGQVVNGARLFPNIAYVEAPVGKKRWRRVALLPTARQRKDPVACPQFGDDNFRGTILPFQEDCLYMNVWTPLKEGDEPYPVILFIHGGGFISGNGLQDFYDGSVFAKHGVVFVAFNYRLAELGFGAHLEKEKGSLGLIDQYRAIQWVVERIKAFGGDPNRIYLMGHSKGAESITALMESGLAPENVKGGIGLSYSRHFDPTNHLGISKIQQAKLPGLFEADWKTVFKMKEEVPVYVPDIPSYRASNEGSHRFQLISAVLYDERFWGQPVKMYCNLAWEMKRYNSYIDGYLFLLHAGRYEHGAEVRSLFHQDRFGQAFRDYLVSFVKQGKPTSRMFSGTPSIFKDSLQVTHFFPWFSLSSSFHDEFNKTDCILPDKAEGSQASEGWLLFERILNFFGYGRVDRSFDSDIEIGPTPQAVAPSQ